MLHNTLFTRGRSSPRAHNKSVAQMGWASTGLSAPHSHASSPLTVVLTMASHLMPVLLLSNPQAPLIQGWSPGNHMFGTPQASRRFASRKAGGVIRWRILDKMENLCHLLLPRQKQIFQLSSWRNPSLCAPGSLDIRNEASETSHQNILGEVAPTSQTLTTN